MTCLRVDVMIWICMIASMLEVPVSSTKLVSWAAVLSPHILNLKSTIISNNSQYSSLLSTNPAQNCSCTSGTSPILKEFWTTLSSHAYIQWSWHQGSLSIELDDHLRFFTGKSIFDIQPCSSKTSCVVFSRSIKKGGGWESGGDWCFAGCFECEEPEGDWCSAWHFKCWDSGDDWCFVWRFEYLESGSDFCFKSGSGGCCCFCSFFTLSLISHKNRSWFRFDQKRGCFWTFCVSGLKC